MIGNNRIAIGFVVFNENKNFAYKINILLGCNLNVYIYDNSPDSKFARNYMLEKYKNRIKYYTSGHNVGLAIAMSTICAHAFYDKYEGLMFFDQDTIFTEDTMVFINNLYENRLRFLSNYIAVSFSNDKKLLEDTSESIEDVLLIRNSGTLFILENLHKINWFNISYFVDGVDYELSFRSSLKKYKLGIIRNVVGFDHVSEQGYSLYNFIGIKYKNRKYNYLRILDIISSSVKLISRSLVNFKFKYFFVFTKNTISFLIIQFILRLSKKIGDNNE